MVHLCYDKTSIDSLARDIVGTITLSDPSLYDEAKHVAEKTGQSLEKVLYDDALHLLYTEPEKYIKELRGHLIPTSRNKDLKVIRQKHTSTLIQ